MQQAGADNGRSSRALAAAVVVVAAVALFGQACGGGDDGKEGPSGPVVPGAGSQPTAAASSTAARPTASPAATVPPATAVAGTLPTPVLPGFPTIALPVTSPEREIIDAINRNGPAYSAALSRLDDSILTTVFAGEALATYSEEVRLERLKSQHSQNALLEIQLANIQRTATTANVNTKERWRFQLANSCSVYSYDEFYQLTLINGQWMITKNQFVRTATSAC